MFKFEDLTINCIDGQKQYINFRSNEFYIYAPNGKGKSLLCKLIDFMLGSGDNIFEEKGMDNGISNIECQLSFGDDILYLMRKLNENKQEFYFKRTVTSEYIQISDNIYNDKITSMLLNNNTTEIENFKLIFDREISHRSMAFMNFIDQKGMGNLISVFTQINSVKYKFYYKDIINFLFNNKNVQDIISKTKELNEKIKLLKSEEEKQKKFDLQESIIRNEMAKLNIDGTDSLDEVKKMFYKFEKTFTRPKLTKDEGDLNFLLRASQSLAEEIKVQSYFYAQGKKIVSRQDGITKLLNMFKEVVNVREENAQLSNIITDMLDDAKQVSNTFSAIDSKANLASLQKEKQEIDKKILIINEGLVKLNYKDIEKSIALISNAFEQIGDLKPILHMDNLREEIKNLKDKISELHKGYDSVGKSTVNKDINEIYSSMNKDFPLAIEDYKAPGFKIIFDPQKTIVYGEKEEKIEIGDAEYIERKDAFNPGSMARQTTWQVIVYLAIIRFIKENFENVPLIPILVMDNISMPYDIKKNNNNYKNVYSLIKRIANKSGIQIIVTSNVEPAIVDEVNYISLENGLNPAYEPER